MFSSTSGSRSEIGHEQNEHHKWRAMRAVAVKRDFTVFNAHAHTESAVRESMSMIPVHVLH